MVYLSQVPVYYPQISIMEHQLQQAVAILQNGGIVAYPTDTVYGLGADVFNERAVSRIFQVKQRPLNQPLPVLLSDESELNTLTSFVSEIARRLANKYWPGGLTLVVMAGPTVPNWITAGGNTIALRVPDHIITRTLIRELGKPLVGTSANLSGLPSVTSAEEVRTQLESKIDFILDGGICPGGIESTVIDVTSEMPIILRDGAVSRSEIEQTLRTSP